MIQIDKIIDCYNNDNMLISTHALERCRERDISQKEIRQCICSGEIIEQYPDDYPFPSCLILGVH